MLTKLGLGRRTKAKISVLKQRHSGLYTGLTQNEHRIQNKDLFSGWTTRLKFQLIHHHSQSTGASLRTHAWTRRTTTTFIMSSAATMPNAAVLDTMQSSKITASKGEMFSLYSWLENHPTSQWSPIRGQDCISVWWWGIGDIKVYG